MDRRVDIMRHFPKRLERWKGADARLWTLTSGHPVLTILLTRPGQKGCLLISCGSPTRIESPRHWSPSDIQIELDTNLFKVTDRLASVLISECEVGISEQDTVPWETHGHE